MSSMKSIIIALACFAAMIAVVSATYQYGSYYPVSYGYGPSAYYGYPSHSYYGPGHGLGRGTYGYGNGYSHGYGYGYSPYYTSGYYAAK